LNARGDTENGFKKFAEAQAVFEQLHAAGATDPDVTYGLALVLYSQGFTALGGGGRGTPEQLQQAADLLKPVVAQKDSPAAARILYANALNVGSHFKKSKEDGVQQCEEALAVLKGLGALELTDLSAASSYADTADSEARHLMSLGRIDEAQKLEQEVYDLTEKLLRLRPNDLHALADRYYAGDLLSILALRRFDFDPAADYARRSVHGGEDYVRFDPSDLQSWGFWIRGLTQVADVEVERGAIGSALGSLHTATALAQDPRRPSSLGPLLFGTWNYIAILEGGRGQHAAAEQALQEALRGNEEAVARYAADDVRRQIFAHAEQFWRSRLRLLERDYKGALDGTTSLVATLDRIKIPEGNSNARRAMDRSMRQMLSTATAAALALDRGAEAETYARRWLTVPADPNSEDAGQDELARGNVSLAHALALQGRFDEARATLAPGFERFATQARAGGAGVTFARDYATALYVSALAQGTDAAATPKREAALAEAARLIAALPAEAREFGAVRWLNEKIATARGSRPG
jgi:tetratricopeptide (TPR) repeat protein